MADEQPSVLEEVPVRRYSFDVCDTHQNGQEAVPGPLRDRSHSCPSVAPHDFRATSFAQQVFAEGATQRRYTTDVGGGLSVNEAVMTMVLNCLGVTMVLFPKIMADIGVIAPLLTLVCAKTCHECGIMISTACQLAEQQDGSRITTYEALAQKVGGPAFSGLLVVTKNVALLGFIIAYAQLLCDSIMVFVPGEDEMSLEDKRSLNLGIRFCFAWPVLSLLAMVTDLKQVAAFSKLGVAMAILKCACMVVGGAAVIFVNVCPDDAKKEQTCRTYHVLPDPLPDAGLLGKYLAIFLASFAILTTVPSVRSQLEEPDEMHRVLSRSFVIVASVNTLVMVAGYVGFAQTVSENIIDGLSDHYPTVGLTAALTLIIQIFIMCPLLFFCTVTVFESAGTGVAFRPLSFPNILVRLAVVTLLIVIGAAVSHVSEILGLVSSVFAVFNNIFFPISLHFLARRQCSVLPQRPLLRHIKYVGAFIVGVFVFIFGFKGSLENLLQKMADDRKVA